MAPLTSVGICFHSVSRNHTQRSHMTNGDPDPITLLYGLSTKARIRLGRHHCSLHVLVPVPLVLLSLSRHNPAYFMSLVFSSDIWSLHGLRLAAKYLKRAVNDAGDVEARVQMHMATAFAGIGFGNAGVHLCHSLSYPISGQVRNFQATDYPTNHPLVPHGLSVMITAPAVFQFTAPACPERHLEVAAILGADVTRARAADAGAILADTLRQLMLDLNVENGISQFGYSASDIPALVRGTLPQARITKLSPQLVGEEEIARIFENSLTIY